MKLRLKHIILLLFPALCGCATHLPKRINPFPVIVKEELKKITEECRPKNAYIIVADPATGTVLANSRYSYSSDFSPTSVVVFEPGAAVKPLVLASALDQAIITPETKINCENGYWKDYCLRDACSLGLINVSDILKNSSYIGIAKIAMKMGKDKLYKAFRSFGMAERTGVSLKPEATGFLPKPHQWDYLSITRFPIGQGITLTPFQLCRAYCMLANGGNRIQLHVPNHENGVAAGQDADNIFTSPYTDYEMFRMMYEAYCKTIEGRRLTGMAFTSQKWVNPDPSKEIKGHYSTTKFHSGFIGFIEREYVILVLLDEPQGQPDGDVVARTVFSRIADRALKFFSVMDKLEKLKYKNRQGDKYPHLKPANSFVQEFLMD